jgi:sulfite reductase (ferredoxin)
MTDRLLALWTKKRTQFASFADFIDGEGRQGIQQIVDRYRDIPTFEEDKNYYYDWSADEAFTIVGRGAGECSAGLFDLIGIDLKAIEEQKKRLAAKISDEEKADALYRIVLSASRMLLVTRGIEAPSDEAVFTTFLQHFIAAGLVAEEHRPLVELAKAGKTAELTARPEAVFTLAESVRLLYESIDNSLRFPAEKPATPATSQAAVALPLRDYRGVACPMNFVKVKLDLAKMKTGEQIKVLLDDGQPIENVPRSVAGEGHLVRDQKREGEHWSVIIEKR